MDTYAGLHMDLTPKLKKKILVEYRKRRMTVTSE